MNRFFRVAVALLLVCVLVVSWSPIRAQASVLGGTALLFGDDAIAIILAVLGGLGVFAVAGSETSDLESRAIARSAMDALEDAGTFVKNGALTVYTSVTEAWSYAVSTDLVQWLHDWMFASGIVENTWSHFSANTTLVNMFGSEYTPLFDVIVYQVSWTDLATNKQYALELVHFINGNTFRLANGTVREATARKYGDKTYYVMINNTLYRSEFAGYHDLGYMDCSAFSAPADAAIAYLFEHYISVNASAVSTPYDLALGTVAPPGTDIEIEYVDYTVIFAPNGVPDTGGDGGDDEQPKIPVLPIPYLPPSEIPNVPQEDIWKGNKVEIENPDTGDTPDPTTGTDTDDPDSGSNDPTTPTTGTDTDPDTGTDVPPADIADYSVDLTNFFPFCLPFDIYAFFELLAADPEAPHLEFDIPFPYMEDPWHLVIDLSEWDSVAELARRLELLAFIIGLCVFTREKFLRS